MAEKVDAKKEPAIVLKNKGMNGEDKVFDIPPQMLRSFARVDEAVPHPWTGELGVLVLENQYEILEVEGLKEKKKGAQRYFEVPEISGEVRFEGQKDTVDKYVVVIP